MHDRAAMQVTEGQMQVTRGSGRLEGFLARQRAAMANALISERLRTGAILDIGCGSYPFFLHNTEFSTKHGLDRVPYQGAADGITITNFDMGHDLALPFADETFSVVTMLAVIEHIEPVRLPQLLAEVRRVLRPGGEFVLTTPAWWTDGLLRLLARLGLVSREEIDEHKDAYSHGKLLSLLDSAGFAPGRIAGGYFELGMNIWAKATK